MNFEQANYDPSREVKEFFQNNKEELKRKAKKALDNGEFKEDSLSFVKSVVENVPEGEIFDYKEEVEKLVDEIKEEKEMLEEGELQKRIDGAKELAEEEKNRTDIHPEDYKEQ